MEAAMEAEAAADAAAEAEAAADAAAEAEAAAAAAADTAKASTSGSSSAAYSVEDTWDDAALMKRIKALREAERGQVGSSRSSSSGTAALAPPRTCPGRLTISLQAQRSQASVAAAFGSPCTQNINVFTVCSANASLLADCCRHSILGSS
jgi:hypothetical protein